MVFFTEGDEKGFPILFLEDGLFEKDLGIRSRFRFGTFCPRGLGCLSPGPGQVL